MEKKLPKNWVETELGKVSEIIRGVSYNKNQALSFRNEDSAYILRGGNIQDGKIDFDTDDNVFVDKKLVNPIQFLKENDVVIVGSTGSKKLIGKAGVAIQDYDSVAFGAFLMLLRTKSINKKFHAYFFQTKFYRNLISELAGGVNINNIRKEYLENMAFPLPPLPEQERIVAKLDLLFAQHEKMKIALEKIPQILKDFRQQILTQAVTGKLTEEWREGKDLSFPTKEKIASEIALELLDLNKENSENKRSIFKQNSISFIRKNIDNDWSFYTVESLCVAIVDCLHETAIFSEEGFNIIDTNNIEPFKLNFNKMRYVDNDFYIKWISRLKPRKGDIAFTREANIGNAAMIPENNLYCIGQRTMLFRFSNLLNDKFCEYFMNSEEFKIQYRPLIKGVASQHINIRDLRLLEFPLPSLEEQTQIVSRVESLFSKIDVIELRYQKLKEKLDQLPQTILHKAFKGELVPQLPTDGDAKDLLKEILALKK